MGIEKSTETSAIFYCSEHKSSAFLHQSIEKNIFKKVKLASTAELLLCCIIIVTNKSMTRSIKIKNNIMNELVKK